MIGRLLVVRHGEPDAAARGVYGCHRGCTGLTPRGREQARLLNHRFRVHGELAGCTAVLSSRLRRAVETAELALNGLGVGEVEQRCDLCELHGGAADGLTLEERRRSYGAFSVVDEPDRPVAPDGESWNELMGRARAALRPIVRACPRSTTLVCAPAALVPAARVAPGGGP